MHGHTTTAQARHAALDVHSIAIIVHALARTSSWAKPASFVDDAVYHGLAQRLLDLTESSCVRTGSGGGGAENWQGGIVGQEVSMLFGGFVKAGYVPQRPLRHTHMSALANSP